MTPAPDPAESVEIQAWHLFSLHQSCKDNQQFNNNGDLLKSNNRDSLTSGFIPDFKPGVSDICLEL